MADNKLVEGINKSGFPLQMGLERQIEESNIGWRVLAHEEHWTNARTGEEGWADLILKKRNARLVIECKRVLEQEWVFLIDKLHAEEEQRCRALRARWLRFNSGDNHFRLNVDIAKFRPSSYEAEYCINVGKNASTGRELLEKTAANVLSATEAIARSDSWRPSNGNQFYFYTAIVTTAALSAAFIDCESISFEDGSVADVERTNVDHMRFVKQLWSGDDHPGLVSSDSIDSSKAQAHTVLVINAKHLIDFLRSFNPDFEDWTY